MAHVKSSGRARQGTPRKGRRLGIKKFGKEVVKTGQIIVRQSGSTFQSGRGTQKGRDFTIFALKNGIINFKKHNGKKVVEVI